MTLVSDVSAPPIMHATVLEEVQDVVPQCPPEPCEDQMSEFAIDAAGVPFPYLECNTILGRGPGTAQWLARRKVVVGRTRSSSP